MVFRLLFPSQIVIVALLLGSLPAQATLLVYKGFAYGATRTDGQSISGQSAAATLGLSGADQTNNSASPNQGSSVYIDQGLSFSNFLSSTGGALRQTAVTGTGLGFSVAGVALDTGTQTGTLYSSFLFRRIDATDREGSFVQARLNTGNTAAASSAYFRQEADRQNAGLPGISYGTGTPSSATGTGPIADTTK